MNKPKRINKKLVTWQIPRDTFHEAAFLRSMATVIEHRKQDNAPPFGFMMRSDMDSLNNMVFYDKADGDLRLRDTVIYHLETHENFAVKYNVNAEGRPQVYLQNLTDNTTHGFINEDGSWHPDTLDLFKPIPDFTLNANHDQNPDRLMTYSTFLHNFATVAALAQAGEMPGISLRADPRSSLDHTMTVYEDDVIGNPYAFEDCGYLLDVDGSTVPLRLDRERMYHLGVSLQVGGRDYTPVFDKNGELQPYMTDPALRENYDFTPRPDVDESLHAPEPEMPRQKI